MVNREGETITKSGEGKGRNEGGNREERSRERSLESRKLVGRGCLGDWKWMISRESQHHTSKFQLDVNS